jgi:hypothetical protein
MVDSLFAVVGGLEQFNGGDGVGGFNGAGSH